MSRYKDVHPTLDPSEIPKEQLRPDGEVPMDAKRADGLPAVPRRQVLGNMVVQPMSSGMVLDPDRHRCISCSLYFMPEEILLQRFFPDKKLCARCLVHEKESAGELKIPACFGKSYDGSSPLCTQICGLQQACLISFADERVDNWKLFVGRKETYIPRERNDVDPSTQKRGSFSQDLVRLLRLLGEPMHYQDLGPLLNKFTNGRFSCTSRNPSWNVRFRRIARKHNQIVFLPGGFYVWSGAWSESEREKHGGLSFENGYKPEKKIEPLREFLMREDQKELRFMLYEHDKEAEIEGE